VIANRVASAIRRIPEVTYTTTVAGGGRHTEHRHHAAASLTSGRDQFDQDEVRDVLPNT
jgi:hypothetical protein